VTGVSIEDDDGLHGAVLAERYVVPGLELTATDGSSYSLAREARRPLTLVFFGYTHCPDICQVVMADIASALTRLDATDREKVGMVFVTSDPQRDDPRTLRTYLDRFDPRFEGLTGELGPILRLGEAVGVEIRKGRRLPSGGYEVAHGTQVLGVDAEGEVAVVWTQGTSAAELAEDLTLILRDGVPPVMSS
jgi:protein SCO1/2